MKFPMTRLKRSIFPYVTLLANIKDYELRIKQTSQYIASLEDALKKNVVPMVKFLVVTNEYSFYLHFSLTILLKVFAL